MKEKRKDEGDGQGEGAWRRKMDLISEERYEREEKERNDKNWGEQEGTE